ncbi:MAG: DUF2961 domain-containing protein [Kiritimatiellae bacterium]|nr:DUF2961 domain-containing protein [Kiritimatiellia bacterium]
MKNGTTSESLSYGDLARRLIDLERLAVLPSPGEACAQWSSYSRASRYDPGTGKYVDWANNDDATGIIRKEGGMDVLAEMEGPGCIWRMWSADASPKAHVRIYLDGNAEPVLDLPYAAYFAGRHAPLNYPSLVYNPEWKGNNCYVPIPYQKSCKITAQENWGRYYHFTYQTFPKGTILPTFRRDLTAGDASALANVNAFLTKKLGTDPVGPRKGEVTETKPVVVTAGKTVSMTVVNGPRAVTALRVKFDLKAMEREGGDPAKALREVALRIFYDGEASPSVWSPLGDFFGTAPGINAYRSLPMGMILDKESVYELGLINSEKRLAMTRASSACEAYSHWYMPFARDFRLELQNEGARRLACEVTVVHAPLSRPIETLGRFHAKWHRDAFLPEEPERNIDWTMLKTTGRGRFCGVMLHVWTPKIGWWGEGDEKFFVDGEKMPSTFGTGSEDYFGYAWCSQYPFQRPFHNQTFNSGQSVGHVSVGRSQIADNVPFQRSFEGAIEKYYPNSRPALYAAIAYWYLEPGGEDPYQPVPLSRRIYYDNTRQPPIRSEAERNVADVVLVEGEDIAWYKSYQASAGTADIQSMMPFGNHWSRGSQLLWVDGYPGEGLDLSVSVKTEGEYEIFACLTRDRDYAMVRLAWDDEPMGPVVDLYAQMVEPPAEVLLGTMAVKAGEHRLTVEITGANERAYRCYKVGVDYIILRPATRRKGTR